MQVIDLNHAMNPSPLKIKLDVENLHMANRHKLVEWLREWARDIESRPQAELPQRVKASL